MPSAAQLLSRLRRVEAQLRLRRKVINGGVFDRIRELHARGAGVWCAFVAEQRNRVGGATAWTDLLTREPSEGPESASINRRGT